MISALWALRPAPTRAVFIACLLAALAVAALLAFAPEIAHASGPRQTPSGGGGGT